MCEYYEKIAEIYEYDVGLNRGMRDFPFYASESRSGSLPVLECACGTGRLTIPLAQCGYYIHGLDLSSAMLNQLSQRLIGMVDEVCKRITFQLGDMRNIKQYYLPNTFSHILVPYSAIMYLLDLSELDQFFEAASKILCPGGTLVFDWFLQDNELLNNQKNYIFEYRRSLSELTTAVIGCQWNEFSREKRIEHNSKHLINTVYKRYSFFLNDKPIGDVVTLDQIRLHTVDEVIELSLRYGYKYKFTSKYLVGSENLNHMMAYVGKIIK